MRVDLRAVIVKVSTVASTFLIASTLFGGAARASHYATADVPRLIDAPQVEKLHKAGVETTEQLLDKGAKAKDRKALAKASGLKPAVVLDLVRRCDLLRLKGVGSEMVLLLEAAGVKTTAELAKQTAPALMESINKANQAKKISEKPPTEPQVGDWIAQAQKLPQVLEEKQDGK
jgi:predicted flap endonuclease-1-like 5' DNA nuclease